MVCLQQSIDIVNAAPISPFNKKHE